MAAPIALQLWPEQRGVIGAPSAWFNASTTTPTVSGVYRGTASKTYYISTPLTGGTIGSGSTWVDWDDNAGQTGRIWLGAGYVAGTAVPLHDGMFIGFSAGAFDVSGDAFTLAVVAWRRVPRRHIRIASGGHCWIDWKPGARQSRDVVAPAVNGDSITTKVSMNRAPVLEVDWLDAPLWQDVLRGEADRADWAIAENYDRDTIFLLRGAAGLDPLIGPPATFARASAGTYLDERSGLYRVAPSGTYRPRAGLASRGFHVDGVAVTNLLPRFHPKSGALGWTATGSATIAWEAGAPTILDPEDDGWKAAFRAGAARAYIPTGDTVHSDDATVSASTNYSATVYLAGRGQVDVRLRSGAGTPGTVIATLADQVLTSTPTRYTISGLTGGGHSAADISIIADENSVVFISAAQIELGVTRTHIVETDGATATRAAEALTYPLALPPDRGTVFMAWYTDASAAAADLVLLEGTGVSGSERFRLNYSRSAGQLQFHTATSTPLVFATTPAAGWHTLAFTWDRGTANTIWRLMYIDGALVANSVNAGWASYFGSGIQIGRIDSGGTNLNAAFEEIRIDRVARTGPEIAALHDRLTDADWLALHREFGGRGFLIGQHTPGLMDEFNTDKVVVNLQMVQSRAHEPSLVVAR